jgi:hypothetical protein
VSGPGCPVCGFPRIPWPCRPGLICVNGHGLDRAAPPAAPAVLPPIHLDLPPLICPRCGRKLKTTRGLRRHACVTNGTPPSFTSPLFPRFTLTEVRP